MSGTRVREALTALRAAHDALADCDVDLLTRDELVEALDELETLGCQLPTQSRRMLARLQRETTAREMGAKSFKEVLAIRWRITHAEAGRRLTAAAQLGPRQSLTGEPLAPVWEATAAAAAKGLINAEHVEVIGKAMNKLPGFVGPTDRVRFEVDMVRHALGMGPKELQDTAAKTIFLMDQDGPEPDDRERERQRGISRGTQRRNGNVPITAELTPEAWATWEPIFAKYAAPGMCNPADEQPCTSGTPTQAQIDNDHRTIAQRRHDALVAVGRIALMSGELGSLNGLPVSIIVRTTLQDLESRAGVGVTGGGTIVPIADVIRLGAHAHHYLAVFDGATGSAMNLFRSKRIASLAQRIMAIARDGGCTKPGGPVGAYGCQVHHAVTDWGEGGFTNVDDNGLACGADNRMVGEGGWRTRMNDQHEVEWIPPPLLDTGQARVNYYHRPERLLAPPEDDPPATSPPQVPPPNFDEDDNAGVTQQLSSDEPEPLRDGVTRRDGGPEPPRSHGPRFSSCAPRHHTSLPRTP